MLSQCFPKNISEAWYIPCSQVSAETNSEVMNLDLDSFIVKAYLLMEAKLSMLITIIRRKRH